MENATSFEQICEIEPQLAELYQLAKEGKLKADPNYMWNNFWKIKIEQLVGPKSANSKLNNDISYCIVVRVFQVTLGMLPEI